MLRRLIDGISYRVTRLSLRRKALKLHAANLMRLEIPAASCLYLCYGNIMRSPFAENLAKVQRSELRIGGGGFHPNTGRECPPACVATAQRFDIDLGTHRSRAVTIDDVRSFDVIFVTDLRVLGLLLEQFPSAADRVLMLGLFGAGFGTILGLLITTNINAIEHFLFKLTGVGFDRTIYYFDLIPTKIEPATVSLVNLGAIAIAVAFSVWPAIRAAWLRPVQALRYE